MYFAYVFFAHVHILYRSARAIRAWGMFAYADFIFIYCITIKFENPAIHFYPWKTDVANLAPIEMESLTPKAGACNEKREWEADRDANALLLIINEINCKLSLNSHLK